MQKLKILLRSNWFYILLFLVLLIRVLVSFTSSKISIFDIDDTSFVGRVQNVEIGDDSISVIIKVNGEIISGKLYSLENDLNLKLNDLVKITGTLKEIMSPTVFQQFNYKSYALRHNQYYSLNIKDVYLIEENKNLMYSFKNFLIEKINLNSNSDYLHAFILGNTSYIKEEVMESYRNNGVSHLLAVSGMHISFLMGTIYRFFNKLKLRSFLKLSLTIIILAIYAFLIGFTPSVLRSSFFFLFLKFNSIYSLEISVKKIFFVVFFIVVFMNPNFLYETGFQYSFLISFILILFSNYLEKEKNYFIKIFKVSFISFVASLPITVYYFHQINLLGVFYNLLFVPFASSIIFPLSFLVLFIKPLSFIYTKLLNFLECVSLYFDTITFGKLIMRHPENLLLFGMVVFVILCLYLIYKSKKISFLVFIIGVYFYNNINMFIKENYMVMLDVSQGDSIFLHSNNQNILIDTGGVFSYDIANNTIIPYLKTRGVNEIDVLVLTHGDYDHMGEAINLVNNFKVEKVIFNCGEFNELERELIKVLDKKKITYSSCIKDFNIDDNKLYFLNNRDYGNENDNSSVIYTKLNNYKFLFMGDAGIEVEKDLIEKYNLQNIDVLKVGHHGSKTSSSKEFIDEVNPKYSIISVGKNNRYGHPNDNVLDNLEDSKIYRTDQDGSIIFKIKNNKLQIYKCVP